MAQTRHFIKHLLHDFTKHFLHDFTISSTILQFPPRFYKTFAPRFYKTFPPRFYNFLHDFTISSTILQNICSTILQFPPRFYKTFAPRFYKTFPPRFYNFLHDFTKHLLHDFTISSTILQNICSTILQFPPRFYNFLHDFTKHLLHDFTISSTILQNICSTILQFPPRFYNFLHDFTISSTILQFRVWATVVLYGAGKERAFRLIMSIDESAMDTALFLVLSNPSSKEIQSYSRKEFKSLVCLGGRWSLTQTNIAKALHNDTRRSTYLLDKGALPDPTAILYWSILLMLDLFDGHVRCKYVFILGNLLRHFEHLLLGGSMHYTAVKELHYVDDTFLSKYIIISLRWKDTLYYSTLAWMHSNVIKGVDCLW